MKKLNQRGITTIEVIISFVLVILISASLFTTITAYNTKRLTENYKSQIYTYKNQLTKVIQDDFIKKGLVSVTYNKYTPYSTSSYSELNDGDKANNKMTIYQLDCTLKDGSNRRLVIYQRFTQTKLHPSGSKTKSDYFMIEYGQPDLTKNNADDQNATLIQYPIPDVGSSEATDTKLTSKDLSINNILVSFGKDYSERTSTNVLSLYIGFYHPELSTRYGINIISPIDYISSSSDGTNGFELTGPTNITYMIQYHANGGEGTMDTRSLEYDEEFSIVDSKHPNNFTRKGYKFLGFSRNQNSTAPEYTTSEKLKGLTKEEKLDLYAIWEKKEYQYSYSNSSPNIYKLVIDVAGTYKLETWGAQGGGRYGISSGSHGGPGGYATTDVNLNAKDVLYISVGKQGVFDTNAIGVSNYTGGGKSKTENGCSTGGGATYISKSSSDYTGNTSNLYLIAAGGGGSGGGTVPSSKLNSEYDGSGGAARSSTNARTDLEKPKLKGKLINPSNSSENKGINSAGNTRYCTGAGGAGWISGAAGTSSSEGAGQEDYSYMYSGGSGGISKIFLGSNSSDNKGYTTTQESEKTPKSGYYKLGDGYAKITLIS